MSSVKQVIALDVGARSAKLIWMSLHGSTPTVTRTESFALPLDEEDPHPLIAAWIDSLGLSRRFCVTSLAGTQAVFQSGKIMPNDPRSPEEVAAMDIAQFSEMAGDEMRYDVFAFESPVEPNTRRYLMSMARPAVIQDTIQTLALNHLRPADIIAAPVALYNAVEAWSESHSAPWCAVHIGQNVTEFEIGLKEGLLFARAIPLGGKLFTEAVMQATGLPAVQAEVRKHGDCGLRESDGCFEQLRAAADRWISQFNACLGVYRSQFQDRKLAVGKLILSGGTAQLKGFRNYLALKLGLPVITIAELRGEVPEPVQPPPLPTAGGATPGLRLAKPISTGPSPQGAEPIPPVSTPSSKPTPPVRKRDRSVVPAGFEIAYGLGLVALGVGATALSLLPPDLKDEVIFQKKKPWWIAAGVFLLGSMAVYSATGLYLIERDKTLLEKEQEKLDLREKIDRQIQKTHGRSVQIVTNAVPLNELLVNGPLARDVLSLVASTVDPNDWITLFCDEKIYTPSEQKTETVMPAGEAAKPRSFSLFRSLRPRRTAKTAAAPVVTPVQKSEEEKAKKQAPAALTSTFIVEGYTPDPSLRTVQEMISRLRTAPEVKKVDLKSDDQVLRPTGIPELEQEKLPDFKRFVIQIEVIRS